jgi:WD40 repeat protein
MQTRLFGLIVWLLALSLILPVHAQNGGDPITPENARELVPVRQTTAAAFLDLGWSPDGSTLVLANRFGALVYDLAADQQTLLFEDYMDIITGADFSPDGTLLAIGSTTGLVQLRDTTTGEVVAAFEGHTKQVVDVAFSPDNTLVASAGFDGTARVWDIATGESRVLDADVVEVDSVAFSPDGTLLVTGIWDGRVIVWDVATATVQTTLEGH